MYLIDRPTLCMSVWWREFTSVGIYVLVIYAREIYARKVGIYAWKVGIYDRNVGIYFRKNLRPEKFTPVIN